MTLTAGMRVRWIAAGITYAEGEWSPSESSSIAGWINTEDTPLPVARAAVDAGHVTAVEPEFSLPAPWERDSTEWWTHDGGEQRGATWDGERLSIDGPPAYVHDRAVEVQTALGEPTCERPFVPERLQVAWDEIANLRRHVKRVTAERDERDRLLREAADLLRHPAGVGNYRLPEAWKTRRKDLLSAVESLTRPTEEGSDEPVAVE